jgi:phospholipase/carboxylesterase
MQQRETHWGGLTCRVIDALPAGTAPKLGVLLCHGYGAPGTDLLPFAAALGQIDRRLADGVQFVFPEAPLTLEDIGHPIGRAWWRLDLERLQRQLQSRQVDEVRNNQPAELPAARRALTEVLAEWSRDSGLPVSRCVLGGFSQGAMLSIDVALHLPESPAGLAVLSGCLHNEQEWLGLVAARSGLPVFQSHGTYDYLLPYFTGLWVRDLLETAGCAVEFVEFPGGHEIPWNVLERLAAFLVARLP